MLKELHQVLKNEEIINYKRFKIDNFRKKRELSVFRNWLKEQGYVNKVCLPLYADDKGNYNDCLSDYFLILHSLDEVSAIDTLESGFEVIRNEVRILREDLVGGVSKDLCLYTKEYERILSPQNVKYLILNLERLTCFNLQPSEL